MQFKQIKAAVVTLSTLGLLAGCGTVEGSPPTDGTGVSNATTNVTNTTINKTAITNTSKSPSPHFVPASISFVNSNTGYVSGKIVDGTSSTGCVYKTTDGGHTWKELLQKGTTVSNVAVVGHDMWIDVKNHQNGNLYFSKDGGQEFTKISSVSLASIDFTSKTVGWAVYLGNYPNDTIMKTTDGGKHWSQVHVPKVESGGGASISFANSKVGFLLEGGQPGAGNQGKALLQTTDSGQTWKVVSKVSIGAKTEGNQLASIGYADGIDIVPSHPSHAYISESRGPLLYTSDGGKSWHASSVSSPDIIESRGVSMLGVQHGFILLQDMVHSDFVLEQTTNGGASWNVVYKWSYS